ncbi:MAG: hypothetical protein SXQ77_00300, partial [Halobacteria archaeon]|nr:hypothetical protein [Halobacteria archaeon]
MATEDREMSFWGWGYADKLPDESQRENMANLVESFLGFGERPFLEIPTLDDVAIPDPEVTADMNFCTTAKK